jgi:hypothetical protein
VYDIVIKAENKLFLLKKKKKKNEIVNEIYSEWLEHLAVNAKVAKVLGSILASSDTMESEG